MERAVRPAGTYSVRDEAGELLVGGKDFRVDGGGDPVGEALLVGVGEGGRELFEREEEGVGGDDAVALARGSFRPGT